MDKYTLDMNKKILLFLNIIVGTYMYAISSTVQADQDEAYVMPKLITMSSNSELIIEHLAAHDKKNNYDKQTLDAAENNYIVSSLKANNIRITMGTSILNAIHLKVTDQNDNPIPDLKVVATGKSDLIIAPGWADGALSSEMKTNGKGEFIGMLVSDHHTRTTSADKLYSTTSVTPTINEYDTRIPGNSSYQLVIEVAGTKLKYYVDVDMGPSLVISNDSESMFNSSQWIGMKTKEPVGMTLIYYQRTSECKTLENQSIADWIDEDFSSLKIRKINVYETPHKVIAERYDRNNNSIELVDDFNKSESSADQTGTGTNNINNIESRPMRHSIVMDHAKGDILITYNLPKIKIEYNDGFCKYRGDIRKLPTNNRSFKTTGYPLINTIPLRSSSPKLSLVIKDHMPPEPDPDPLPSIKSYSGINLDKIIISLNDRVIFGESVKNIHLNQYPHYIKAIADNLNVSDINEDSLKEMAPGIFEFIYYPTFDQLNISGINTITVTGIEDKVGNKSSDIVSTFTIPQ